MIVMGLGGLWHGAGLSYLMWGLMHGVFLVIERPILPLLTFSQLDCPSCSLQRWTVFLCVSMLWIFFKLPDFDHAASYLVGPVHPHLQPEPDKTVLQSCASVLASGHHPAFA